MHFTLGCSLTKNGGISSAMAANLGTNLCPVSVGQRICARRLPNQKQTLASHNNGRTSFAHTSSGLPVRALDPPTEDFDVLVCKLSSASHCYSSPLVRSREGFAKG
jgi:hypothetical protein